MNDGPMIEVSGLYKIFGARPEAAMPLVEKGLGKDEIFEQTGQTIGVHDADCPSARGKSSWSWVFPARASPPWCACSTA